MKKILAVLTLLAVTTVSSAAFAAGCGSNAPRNASTRPAAGGTTAGTTGAPAGGGITR